MLIEMGTLHKRCWGGKIQALWKKRAEVSKLTFEFPVLTSAYPSEILLARWNEMNIADHLRTIPSKLMKTTHEHQVPLSECARKPTDNAFIESFNGSLRDECLNVHWFEDLTDAQQKIQAWRREYNESRPHRSLMSSRPWNSRSVGPNKGQKFADALAQEMGASHAQ